MSGFKPRLQEKLSPVWPIMLGGPLGEEISLDDNYVHDVVDKRISEINPKPIFIFGVPESMDMDTYKDVSVHLENKLQDYHVIVIINNTNSFSAKIYSTEGIETVSVDEIKKYITHKIG